MRGTGESSSRKICRSTSVKCEWYHPSPAFNEASLSKTEREVVSSIQAYETYLQKMTATDRQHYDSVKAFSRSDAAFDTTIVDRIDYTGDGKKDKCVTTIMQAENRVLIRHVIISGNDTIYDKESRASFAPDRDLPLFDVYNNVTTAIRLSPFKASLRLVSPDIKKLYNGKKEIKRYLARFKGRILVTVTSESAGCSYFWYAPAKKVRDACIVNDSGFAKKVSTGNRATIITGGCYA